MKNNVSFAKSSNDQFQRISFTDLHRAIEGFLESNNISVGSYGSVYKEILDQDGTTSEVKVFNLPRRGASKSFMANARP